MSGPTPGFCIFIPAYNAGRHLASVLERIPRQTWQQARTVWVVNDGSTDDTASVIERASARYPKLRAVELPRNRGYGGAVKEALRRVRAEGAGAAVCLHADGQYAPEEIPGLLRSLSERRLDILQGSRLASGGALSGGMPLYKYVAGHLLTALENVVFRMKMTDYHSGYLLYGKKALEEAPFEELSDGFEFDLEVIAAARARGMRIGEAAIPTRYGDEVSHLEPVSYGLRALRVVYRFASGYYSGLGRKRGGSGIGGRRSGTTDPRSSNPGPRTPDPGPRQPRVVLVNPPSRELAYVRPGRASIARVHPPLGLASLAASVRGRVPVRVLDLNVEADPALALAEALRSFRPTHVGVTGSTPMFGEMLKVLRSVKAFDRSITTVAGGVHVSALPEEAAGEEEIDVVVVGEGEETFAEMFGKEIEDVPGLCFLDAGAVHRTGLRPPIDDLDALPLPAWDTFELARYRAPVAVERNPPGGLVETSRGCPHNCWFCCKVPFGRRYRQKSAARVVEDFCHMRRAGFGELHVEDDGFSEDLERAKEVCRALVASPPGVPWTLLNGVRADRFDGELAELLVRAGCYQCGFGVEAASASTLGRAGKDILPGEVVEAVTCARRAGLETIGYFVLGLPGETEDSLRETISFACSLPLDYAKFSLFVPYPGSEAFDELEREGRILTRDWSAYLFHDLEREVFRHDVLRKAVLAASYREAYRRFYLRLPYVLRRLVDGLRKGTFWRMVRDFTRTRW